MPVHTAAKYVNWKAHLIFFLISQCKNNVNERNFTPDNRMYFHTRQDSFPGLVPNLQQVQMEKSNTAMVTLKQSLYIHGKQTKTKKSWNSKLYKTSHPDTALVWEQILYAATVSGWNSPSTFTNSNTLLYPVAVKTVWEEIELEITMWKVKTVHNFTTWSAKGMATCPNIINENESPCTIKGYLPPPFGGGGH